MSANSLQAQIKSFEAQLSVFKAMLSKEPDIQVERKYFSSLYGILAGKVNSTEEDIVNSQIRFDEDRWEKE